MRGRQIIMKSFGILILGIGFKKSPIANCAIGLVFDIVSAFI